MDYLHWDTLECVSCPYHRGPELMIVTKSVQIKKHFPPTQISRQAPFVSWCTVSVPYIMRIRGIVCLGEVSFLSCWVCSACFAHYCTDYSTALSSQELHSYCSSLLWSCLNGCKAKSDWARWRRLWCASQPCISAGCTTSSDLPSTFVLSISDTKCWLHSNVVVLRIIFLVWSIAWLCVRHLKCFMALD